MMDNKENTTVDKEMEVLLTESATVQVTLNGEVRDVEVKPYSWADTFRMAKPFGVVFSAITTHIDALIAATSQEGMTSLGQLKAISDVIMGMDSYEEVIDSLTAMVVKATSLSKDEVESLAMDDFITVGMKVYEVNKTFFTKRLLPKLTAEKATPDEKSLQEK